MTEHTPLRSPLLTVENKIGLDAWIKNYAPNTQKVYKPAFELFIQFMNATEEGIWNDLRLINERRNDVRNETYAFEHKVVEFYEWLKTVQPSKLSDTYSDGARKGYSHAIRSFFAYHRLDLKFTKPQKDLFAKKPKPKRRFYEFSLDDIKHLADLAKPKERYILLVGKDVGLRAGDFINLKQGTFTAHLDEEPPVSLGEIYTTKEGATAKPFLSFDGKQTAQHWLAILKTQGKEGADKPMLDIGEKELTATLQRLAKKAALHTGNQLIRFHQLRVFLITRLSDVLESNRWKQIVGKQVPESSYVKPFSLRSDYKKVLPLITINTTSLPQKVELQKINKRIMEVQAENVYLRKEIEKLKETKTEEIENIKKEVSRLRSMVTELQHENQS